MEKHASRVKVLTLPRLGLNVKLDSELDSTRYSIELTLSSNESTRLTFSLLEIKIIFITAYRT